MSDSEIQFPIRCPVCRQELLTAFRLSIVADGLATGDLRLYATCHVAGWDASRSELELIRRFVLANEELSLDELPGGAFAFPGLIEEIEYESVLR